MSKVEKKKPNEFMKSLNNFSNKMFEKSTGLTAPNTSDYEDEPYSYNVPTQSSVYIQQPSDRQYIKHSISFTNAFRTGFFFTLGCMAAAIVPFIITFMIVMALLAHQSIPIPTDVTPPSSSVEQVVPNQSQDESQSQ